MSFIDKAEKNVNKYLNETSVGGMTGTFTGRRGFTVDTLFAGPFHPEFG